MRKTRKTRALLPPGEHPATKKDGTPWVPWEEEAAARVAKWKEREATMTPEELAEYRKNKCTAMTTGVHGEKRPCDRVRMKGQKVCYVHGGNTPAAKKKAQSIFLEELEPSINALKEIRDQRDHMPSALGAANQLINRAIGKVANEDKDKGASRPVINVGIAIGGLPKSAKDVKVITDAIASTDGTVDAEVLTDEG
jgi:hypothetical protein